MDNKRRETGQKLLDAAYDFWEACQEEGQSGAIQWLSGTGGELIIFTRSEYREQLIGNIFNLSESKNVHTFSEEMPDDESEEDK